MLELWHAIAMSFLDRIRHCNRYELSDFVPFHVGETKLGWIRRPLSLELRRFGARFHVFEDLVHLHQTGQHRINRSITYGTFKSFKCKIFIHWLNLPRLKAVSYTHLTLPTIYSV